MQPDENSGESPEPHPVIPPVSSGRAPYCLPRLSDGERELAEYYIKTGSVADCASKFKVPLLSVEKILNRSGVIEYLNIRQLDITESMGITREKVLARLNALLDNRLDAGKNMVRGIEISAKILGMIRSDVAVALVNISPYAQLTQAELEAEIRKRLNSPVEVEVIDVESEETKPERPKE